MTQRPWWSFALKVLLLNYQFSATTVAQESVLMAVLRC